MSPITICFSFFLGIMILVLPRAYAIIPLLLGSCYVTLGPTLMVGPLDFTVFRIVVSFGWMRAFIRSEYSLGGFNALDKLTIGWAVVLIITGTILNKNMEGFINRLGIAYDAVGLYFLFRFLIRDMDDVERVFRFIAVIFIPLALAMTIEKFTHRNLFAVLGGVPEFSQIRQGKIRAQGPFLHPILAGTAGATTLPLLISLWWSPKQYSKYFAVIGVAGCCIMTVMCASSGPIMSLVLGVGALFFWKYRVHMKRIRNSIFLSLLGLHIVMKDPVWYLLARIDITGGSTGRFRARLISSAFEHLNEWWFCGTNYTRHWMATGVQWSQQHTDITNHYLKMGVIGGLPLMIVFIVLIVVAFQGIGKALRGGVEEPFYVQFIFWSIGTTLFSHTVTFISVSYFDQTIVLLYLNFALASLLSCFEFIPDSCTQAVNAATKDPLCNQPPLRAF